MKICVKCKNKKSTLEYHKKSNSSDGLSHTCKTCKSLIDKKYKEANRDKLKQKFKDMYYKNHEETLRKSKEAYHNASIDTKIKRKAKKAEYSKTAPAGVKQRKKDYDKKYFASEAGKLTTIKSTHKRRAQKITTEDGTITTQALTELKVKQEYKCYYCSIPLDFTVKRNVHLDHVIPLSKGGIHSIVNVVWSYASCNLKKSNITVNM